MAPRSISTDRSTDDPVTEPQIELPERSLGECLARARETAGLEPAQVARELHLSPAVILALEEDRYGDLPSPAYVRGYIRAYARLLQLDSEPLIERYNDIGFTDPKPACGPPMPREESAHRAAKVWGTIGVIAILVGLLISWWLNQNVGEAFSENAPRYEQVLVESRLAEESLRAGPAEAVALELPANMKPESQPPETGEKITEAATREMTHEVSHEMIYWTLQEPALSLPLADDSFSPAIEAAFGPSAAGAPIGDGTSDTGGVETGGYDSGPSDSPRQATGPEEDRITVNLNEASWIEIYDANDHRLLYGLLDRGVEYTLEGAAPFEVVLGNSPGVDLSLNGQPYDQSRHDHNNKTARFTVGEFIDR